MKDEFVKKITSYIDVINLIKNKENYKLKNVSIESLRDIKHIVLHKCMVDKNFDAFVFFFNKFKSNLKNSSVLVIAKNSAFYNDFKVLKYIFKHKKRTLLKDSSRHFSSKIILNSLYNDNIEMFLFLLKKGINIDKCIFEVYFDFLSTKK